MIELISIIPIFNNNYGNQIIFNKGIIIKTFLKKYISIFNKIMTGIIPILITLFIWIYAYEISATNFNELINVKLRQGFLSVANDYIYDQIFLCFELLIFAATISLILCLFKFSKKIKYTYTLFFGLIASLVIFSTLVISISNNFTIYATKSLNKKEKINCLLNEDCRHIYKKIKLTPVKEKYLLFSFYEISENCSDESQVLLCIHNNLNNQYKGLYESK